MILLAQLEIFFFYWPYPQSNMQQRSLPLSQWDSHHPLVNGKEKRRSLVTQGISQEAERDLWKPYPLLVDREYEAQDQNTWEGRD